MRPRWRLQPMCRERCRWLGLQALGAWRSHCGILRLPRPVPVMWFDRDPRRAGERACRRQFGAEAAGGVARPGYGAGSAGGGDVGGLGDWGFF